MIKSIAEEIRDQQRAKGCDAYFRASGIWRTTPFLPCTPDCICAQDAATKQPKVEIVR